MDIDLNNKDDVLDEFEHVIIWPEDIYESNRN